MIKRSEFVNLCSLSIIGLVFVACSSSVKRADIPATANPQQEIEKLEADMNAAIRRNVDVLAPGEFSDVRKWIEEAKSDLTKGEKQSETLDDVRKSRNALDKAYGKAENQEAKAPGLFEARQNALKAGAGDHAGLRSDLKEADASIGSYSDNLGSVSAEKLSAIQEQYVTLEKRAVVINHLASSQAALINVRKDNAVKLAPATFKKAELSIKSAESAIATNVRNPPGFEKAVASANAETALLVDVMTTIKQNKNLSEPAALKMVAQKHQIKNLKTDMSSAAATDAAAKAALSEKNEKLASELTNKNGALASAQGQVEIQRAIESARGQFSKDEAEAYQQGGTLVIRMKNVNFASGRSDLPGASVPSLAKVTEVARILNASQIKVEGHTDSLGSESQNKAISEKRALAVASYLKSNGFSTIEVQSEGYGFEKPIATNKTKEGRAQNRRVDIIITPAASTRQ